MRILIINNRFGEFSKGGAEKVINSSISLLKKEDHQVFVITTRPYLYKISDQKTKNIAYIPSLYYFFTGLPKPLRLFWHFLDIFNLVAYLRVKKMVKKIKPDLIMTHNLKGLGSPVACIPKRLNIRHVHVLHDTQLLHPSGLIIYGNENILDKQASRLYRFFNQKYFKVPDKILSPSRWILKLHTKYGFFLDSEKKVIPNPLTLKIEEENYIKKSDKFILLFVGQVEKHKGIEHLIEAYKMFCRQQNYIDSLLFILGSGSLLREYKRKNLSHKSVIFKGYKNRNEIAQEMKRADCLVFSSICYENSPTVIYEALSQGLVVISPNIGGAGEIIRKYGGIFYKPGDTVSLAEKMAWASKNPDKIAEISQKAQNHLKSISIKISDLL